MNIRISVYWYVFILYVCVYVVLLHKHEIFSFDELHYGKYVSLYMKNTFFFDSHPPLGKQLIAIAAYFAGYDGKFKFDKIGSAYTETIPLVAMRLVPAYFGSLLIPISYHLMLEVGLSQWTSVLASVLFLFDNSLLTQSRFMLMESMLLSFILSGLLCLIKFRKNYINPYSFRWWFWLTTSVVLFTCAFCIKYVGFYSCCLAVVIIFQDFWQLLAHKKLPDKSVFVRFVAQLLVIVTVPIFVYLSIFYIHLGILYKAGPHDSIMTSAFQASLEGGLASITRGQPLLVAHGSQITLRYDYISTLLG